MDDGRVVIKVGADISDFQAKMNKVTSDLKNTASSLSRIGKTLSLKITAPLVAMGTVATKAALDIDKAMDIIAAGTGAQGKELEALQQSWKSLAASVTQGFDVSAQVLADFNTRLGLTGMALTDLSKLALDAARLLNEDVNAVVAQASKAMQDWGVSAQEASYFMNKLFAAAQATGIGMSTLSTQLYKYGAALRGMGFDTNSAIALLSQFEKQGVNTELILGSLRIGLGKLANEGITDAGMAFEALINIIKNAESTTEATQIAMEVFGTRAGPDLAAAIREGRFEIEEMVKMLEKSQGAIEKTAAATDGFSQQWQRTKNSFLLAIEPIGTQILGLAERVMPQLQAAFEKVGNAIGGFSEETKQKLGMLIAILAIGGPFAAAVSFAIATISKFGLALLSLATGPAAPIVIVASAITGLIALFYKLKRAKEDSLNAKEVLKQTAAMGLAATGPSVKLEPPQLNLQDQDYMRKLLEQAGIQPYATTLPGIEFAGRTQQPLQPPPVWPLTLGTSEESRIEKFWQEKSWEYQQGLLSAKEYFAMLNKEVAGLRVNTDEWRNRFAELQRVASDIATVQFDQLAESLRNGVITTDEFSLSVERLKTQFEGLPLVIGMLDEQKHAEEAYALVERNKQQQREMAKAAKAATQEIEKFWREMSWEYQQGLLSAEEYFAMLKNEVAGLQVNTDEWRNRFAELQRVASEIATVQFEQLAESLRKGVITAEEFSLSVEKLKTQFEGLPLVVGMLDEQMQATLQNVNTNTSQTVDLVNDLGMTFQSAFENAIIGGQDLRSVLSGLLEDIARLLLRLYVIQPLVNSITGMFSGMLGVPAAVMHGGGVVGSAGSLALAPAGLFVNAPKLHSGLKADEFPAILQRGETVLPRNFSLGVPESNIKIVNVLDPSVVGDYLATSEGEKMVINIVQRNSGRLM